MPTTQEQKEILREIKYAKLADECECKEYFIESIENYYGSVESFLDSINARCGLNASVQDLFDFMNYVINDYHADEFDNESGLWQVHYKHCLWNVYQLFKDDLCDFEIIELDFVTFCNNSLPFT